MAIKVHSYESLGTYDGPGIRLVVFLQGCNFRCLYCANPDTINPQGESKATDPQDILRMATNQKPFFGKKGGITFSGGEPTIQAKDLIPLFRMLKKEGIHICLDTNGSIWNEDVKELLTLTDLVLLDVKEFNDIRHRRLTGHSNAQTLETAAWLEANEKPFWFHPYRMIERVEILPYHTLGVHKYEAMGLDYQLKKVPQNTPEELEEAQMLFETYFIKVYVN